MAGLLTSATDVAAGPEAIPNTFHVDRARVQVRVYDTAVMSAADQTVALRAATGVLAAAGIDITWLPCGRAESSTNPPACDAPLAHDELSVRLVRLAGTPSARGELRLGYSLVDTSLAEGALATVYVDRVEWLVREAGHEDATVRRCDGAMVRGCDSATVHGCDGARVRWCDGATVLGYAIAHEIGHLLLGTNHHGSAGLMRAVWSRSDLQRNDPADWLFTAGESLAMGRALHHRQLQMATNMTWTR